MSEIHPYTITFVVGPRTYFSPHAGTSTRRERTRWRTFIEAYTAEDALTQFKASSKTYLHDARFHAFFGHLYIESVEPGLPRCPKCGAAMLLRDKEVGHSLWCSSCSEARMFPVNLGEAKP